MDLKLEFWQGGRAEFKQTGIYPQWLFFSSQELNWSWNIRFNNEMQIGCLKIKNEVKFYYSFNEIICEVQEIRKGVVGDWIELTVLRVMSD